MASSPFDHPLLSGLLGDAELARQFSAAAELEHLVAFEAALAQAEAEEGVIPAAAATAIVTACGSFAPDHESLAAATARDGVVVPELVRQLRETLAEPHRQYLHFGATSQDVIDTGLVLQLRPVLVLFEQRLQALLTGFEALRQRYGANPLLGRTRMQDALPITAAHRIESWSRPLAAYLQRLAELRPRLLVVQFGGPVGTLDGLDGKGEAVRRRLAAALDLDDTPQWHSQRANLAEFASWVSLLCGSLGKFGADITLMGQNPVGEVRLAGGGTSSAMAHKSNPVRAEVLVALARYSATLLPAMHHALVHEQERSGAAWTLEWLTLPQLTTAAGSSLLTAQHLLGQIADLGATGETAHNG